MASDPGKNEKIVTIRWKCEPEFGGLYANKAILGHESS